MADLALRRNVPDPTLRAASAVLLCTFGEPAIAALRSNTLFERARFANLGPTATAMVAAPGPGETRPSILFNQRSLDALVQAQQYLTVPSLATSGTELTRRLHTNLWRAGTP